MTTKAKANTQTKPAKKSRAQTTDAVRDLFTGGAKLVDDLDVYRSLKSNHLAYTSRLMKKSAELDATNKSIANMQKELKKIREENKSMIGTLRTVQLELDS